MALSGSPSASPANDTRTKHTGRSKAAWKPLASGIPHEPKAESERARRLGAQEAELLQAPEETAETEGQSLRRFLDETGSSRVSRTQAPFTIYRPYTPFRSQGPSEPAEPQAPFEPGLESSPGRSPPARRREQRTPQDELFSQSTILIAPSLTNPQPPRRSSVPPQSDADDYEFPRKWKRLYDLSRPKKQWGIPDRRLTWGNQEAICPISRCALKGCLTRRLQSLAEPKEVSYRYVPDRAQYNFSCGRESVIWEIPSPALFAHPSRRIQELAQPNRFKKDTQQESHLSDHVTRRRSFRMSEPSPRILRLSVAKEADPNYVPPRKPGTCISVSALKAIASPRIIDLAHPRLKIEGLCFERKKLEMPIRPISQAALQAIPSPRILSLAKAKPLHEEFMPARDVYWPVSYAAIHSKISPRIQELAHPSAKSPMHIVYYDPEVFKVKPSALKAHCSQRIEELAIPIARP